MHRIFFFGVVSFCYTYVHFKFDISLCSCTGFMLLQARLHGGNFSVIFGLIAD